MIEDCPETDIGFDALGFTNAHKHRSAECYALGQRSTTFCRTM
jgi:hypothetical protein